MEFNRLIELIESAGYEAQSYSGRGMNGKRCLGIVSDTTRNIELDLIAEYFGWINQGAGKGSIGEGQDLCELLKNSKVDSMGREEIVYWPGIKWQQSECSRDYDSDDLDDLDQSMSDKE